MRCAFILWLFYGAVLFSSSARAQSDNSAGTAEMARLAGVLGRDWNTVEIVQHGKPVPEGAGPWTSHWLEAGLRWSPKAILLARSEETYAGSSLSGGTRARSSTGFSLASRRPLMPVANYGAPRTGTAKRSSTITRKPSMVSAPRFKIAGQTLRLTRTP